jgi:putative PIG3 family NAD(P)H quinone oxidoreductase
MSSARNGRAAVKAIVIEGEGKGARLVLGESPGPELRPGELRIAVSASAVNRADLMQRRGLYPPPPGASPVIGLECAGTVLELAPGVRGFAVGDRVMALLAGGGYAEEVCVDAGSVMPVPAGLSLLEAAAIPEVFLTCHLNLFQLADAPSGGWALVHGGGSGIGTAAIQLLRVAGVRSIVTAGSAEKCARCLELGADVALDYSQGEFAPAVLEKTGGAGVDVVLDSIGAPYLAQHLACLRVGGRLVLIGLMGGAKAEMNLGLLLMKRLTLIGSTLRARPVAEKAEIVRGFRARFGAALESGALRPIVDRVFPLAEAQQAQDLVEASTHFGKVVLQVRDAL